MKKEKQKGGAVQGTGKTFLESDEEEVGNNLNIALRRIKSGK